VCNVNESSEVARDDNWTTSDSRDGCCDTIARSIIHTKLIVDNAETFGRRRFRDVSRARVEIPLYYYVNRVFPEKPLHASETHLLHGTRKRPFRIITVLNRFIIWTPRVVQFSRYNNNMYSLLLHKRHRRVERVVFRIYRLSASTYRSSFVATP